MTREIPYLGSVLQVCATLSILLGFVGIVLYAAGGAHADSAMSLSDVAQGLLSLNPLSVTLVGILVLVISPTLWIAAALVGFIRSKSTFYVCLGSLILVLIGASFVLTS
ncbi:MAG: DUF1634 domain-containing protein [Halobacteriota archaeon]